MRFALFALVAALAFGAYVDECSQYPTCQTCLDVTASTGQGGRDNCGWCHFNIQYEDGSTGKRCADIRDRPWQCKDLYDTYQCTVGYECNWETGKCEMASAGEGYGNISTCAGHCFPTPDLYKCNTTSYTCMKCAKDDTSCFDQSSACDNCIAPPEMNYKCVDNQCTICQNGDSGCSSREEACGTTCHQPEKTYKCDETKLQCVEAESGLPGSHCNATCSNSTPPALVGVYRGIEVHKGFKMGEIDYEFTSTKVTYKNQDGKTVTGTVSQTPDYIKFTWADGSSVKAFMQALNSGNETASYALVFGSDLPESMEQAMTGAKGQSVHLIHKCNAWKSSCDFSSVFSAARGEFRRSLQRFMQADPSNPNNDMCNQFSTCSTCIGKHSDLGIQCGWCLGGTLVYNQTGDSGMHCGGFADGKPWAFTCQPEFRTVDCSGYSCNWNSSQPTCSFSESGQYGDEESCSNVCKAAEWAKCNNHTKKCESCEQGSEGCIYAKDSCDTYCSQTLKHAKCDYKTKQCSECDPSTDKNCTMSQSDCSYKCGQNYGLCDPESGKCSPCDPSTDKGCVLGCADTCTVQPTTNYYTCDWSGSNPTCKKDVNGTLSKDQCSSWCVPIAYAKCDADQGVCYACNHTTDSDCIFPQANCQASCQKKPSLSTSGIWRGNEISQGFQRGEFDFSFADDGTVTILFGDMKITANVTEVGRDVTFQITGVKGASGIEVGDVFKGVFEVKKGWSNTFNFLYIGFTKAGGSAPNDLDDTMVYGGSEFVLVSCAKSSDSQDAQVCDFSSVIQDTIVLNNW